MDEYGCIISNASVGGLPHMAVTLGRFLFFSVFPGIVMGWSFGYVYKHNSVSEELLSSKPQRITISGFCFLSRCIWYAIRWIYISG